MIYEVKSAGTPERYKFPQKYIDAFVEIHCPLERHKEKDDFGRIIYKYFTEIGDLNLLLKLVNRLTERDKTTCIEGIVLSAPDNISDNYTLTIYDGYMD